MFSLNGSVRRDASVDETDTLYSKAALHLLGKYEVPDEGITPWPDEAMFAGIKSLQEEHGLQPDEVMNPAGPTITKVNELLGMIDTEGVEEVASKGGRRGARSKKNSDRCYEQYERDSVLCRMIPERSNSSSRRVCWQSASERLAACISGSWVPPLRMGP